MFIVIDGPDGAGKTTAAKKLVELINGRGGKAVYTAEPTDGETGKEIRALLSSFNPSETAKLTELFIKDRAEHITQIEELLGEGFAVVCDRYKYSTVVYQQTQGEPLEKLLRLNGAFPDPDYAFIINADSVDTLLTRISVRGIETEIFETRERQKKVMELYNSLDKYYKNIIFVDANMSLNGILDEISKKIFFI